MKRAVALVLCVAAMGCDADLMTDLAPTSGVEAQGYNLKAIEAKIAELLDEKVIGPQGTLMELTVERSGAAFTFTAEVEVRVRSSTPGFAGGYLYRTELYLVKGAYNPQTRELEDVSHRKVTRR